MKLWIRDQDKRLLIPIKDIISIFDNCIFYQGNIIGQYKTEERALEVLNEISSKLKNQFLVKPSFLIKPSELQKMKERFEKDYIGNFIISDGLIDIEPINKNMILYEMPKE